MGWFWEGEGERKRKSGDGSDYSCGDTIQRIIGGKVQSEEAIKIICKRNVRVTESTCLARDSESWYAIKQQIPSNDGQFNKVCIAVKVDSFKDNFVKNKKNNLNDDRTSANCMLMIKVRKYICASQSPIRIKNL